MTITLLALDDPSHSAFQMHLVSKITGLPVNPIVASMRTSMRSARGIEYAGRSESIRAESSNSPLPETILPEFHASTIDTKTLVTITNQTEFQSLNTDLLHRQTVYMEIHGNTTTFILGKRRSIVLNKRVRIIGLNGPQSIVTSIKSVKQFPPLHAIAEVTNPSPLEINLVRIKRTVDNYRSTNWQGKCDFCYYLQECQHL